MSLLATFSALLADPGYTTQRDELRGWIRAYLAALVQVPRFVTNVLFLDARERGLVREVLGAVGADGELARAWGV